MWVDRDAELPFPLPNQPLCDCIIVASCPYRDCEEGDIEPGDEWPLTVYLVLLLAKESPYFRVAHVSDKWEILHQVSHLNIVEAVATYVDWGGGI